MKNSRRVFTKVYPQSSLFEYFLKQPILKFVYVTGQWMNKISKQILKDWLSSQLDVTKTKQKQLLHISLIQCDLQNHYLQFSQFSQVATKCLPSSTLSSICTYTSLSRINFAVLVTETMSREFREVSKIRREQIWRFCKRSLIFEDFKMAA